ALCLEERTGKTITNGEIFYHANRRRERVQFTTTLRQATEEAIQAAKEALKKPIPKPIEHPKKCRDCSLKGICLPKEVKKLRCEV
nr:Dna2/Cas4 domain-containing protein [Mastigocoleus sp. MO_167.B18]